LKEVWETTVLRKISESQRSEGGRQFRILCTEELGFIHDASYCYGGEIYEDRNVDHFLFYYINIICSDLHNRMQEIKRGRHVSQMAETINIRIVLKYE
jgi:hypothetical protein